jgi:hypothetical protein
MAAYALRIIVFTSLSGVFWDILKAQETQIFVLIPNRKLNTTNQPSIVLQKRLVANQLMCAHWCLRSTLCLSFNLEKDSESNKNKRGCELLSVDEKLRPDLIRENTTSDYYTTRLVSRILS